MKKAAERFLQIEEPIGLCILFSYDYMYLTHICISEFLDKGTLTKDNILKLSNLIE
jgi:hypothetical protein